jgi:hypothetical protein
VQNETFQRHGKGRNIKTRKHSEPKERATNAENSAQQVIQGGPHIASGREDQMMVNKEGLNEEGKQDTHVIIMEKRTGNLHGRNVGITTVSVSNKASNTSHGESHHGTRPPEQSNSGQNLTIVEDGPRREEQLHPEPITLEDEMEIVKETPNLSQQVGGANMILG